MPVASRCGLRPSSSGTFSWARAASSTTRHSRSSVLRSSRSLRRNGHGRCADLESRLLSGQRWIYVDQQSLLKIGRSAPRPRSGADPFGRGCVAIRCAAGAFRMELLEMLNSRTVSFSDEVRARRLYTPPAIRSCRVVLNRRREVRAPLRSTAYLNCAVPRVVLRTGTGTMGVATSPARSLTR